MTAKIKQVEKSQINFNGVMALAQNAVMSRLNCHNIGKILEFDADTQRCTVQLMQVKLFNEQNITPVPITDVPLIILGAGNAHITMPDPVGTICLLLFMDRNIDTFLETGELYAPDTTRMHDFSDCVALTTFTTLVNPIQNYDTEAVTIFHKQLVEAINYESYIKVYGNSVQINSSAVNEGENEEVNEGNEPVITSGNLAVNSAAVTASTSSGGQIQVSDKINVQNTAQNLANLIQAFLTACENIAVATNTGVLTPAAKQAFTDLKSQFEELLE